MSERRIRNNKIRRQHELKTHLYLSFFTLCIAFALAFGIFSIQSNAKDTSKVPELKYYTSITVSEGDSLWSIAKEYMNPYYYTSASDYINEVITMNSLANETIYTGQHLIIPYYSAEYTG